MIGLERGNPLKVQQRNTLRHYLFACHILAATQVKSSIWGCLGGSAAQLWEVLHVSSSVGVAGAQVHWAAAGKGVLSSNTVAICMVIYTVTLCPLVTLKKLSQKSRESSSNVYSLLDTLWFHPTSCQTDGAGTEHVGFIVAGWRSLTFFSGEAERKRE